MSDFSSFTNYRLSHSCFASYSTHITPIAIVSTALYVESRLLLRIGTSNWYASGEGVKVVIGWDRRALEESEAIQRRHDVTTSRRLGCPRHPRLNSYHHHGIAGFWFVFLQVGSQNKSALYFGHGWQCLNSTLRGFEGLY